MWPSFRIAAGHILPAYVPPGFFASAGCPFGPFPAAHSLPHKIPVCPAACRPAAAGRGFPLHGENGLSAVMLPPSRSPLQKIFVTRFSAFCRSVFPCLFPGAAILPPPGIPCRFHDTDISPSAIFRVTFSPLTSLLYIWNVYDTPYCSLLHFRVSFEPSLSFLFYSHEFDTHYISLDHIVSVS